MANVSYWAGSWASGGDGDDLGPGESHNWIMWGFDYGDAVSLSAHPVVGAPVERYLAVENTRIEADPNGRRLYFTVRNVGQNSVPGYTIGYSWVSQ
jgi:hypothetical protein